MSLTAAENMTRTRAMLIVSLLLLAALLVRLPNLSRPVSKHHEFMTALILINMESWREGGGGEHFHYIPVLNFQHPGDKYKTGDVYVNKNGDRWYLSLGPGWYILPYFLYQLFHLPAMPGYLRVVNILINLLSVVLFFRLCEQLIPPGSDRRYFRVSIACGLFLFTPGMLWYTGNGYTHTVIVMPMVLSLLLLLLPMLSGPARIRPGRLVMLGLLIILFLYFDWLALFLCFVAICMALNRWKKDKRYGWLALSILLGVLMGITLLWAQFSSIDGTGAVMAYWKARFLFRGIPNQSVAFPRMLFHLLSFHSVTAYLPLLMLLVITYVWLKYKQRLPRVSGEERIFVLLYSWGVLLYNLIFLEWSYEHEFSLMPWSPLLAWLGAKWMVPLLNKRTTHRIMAGYLVATLVQYYFINRPGNISRDGMPYDTFRLSGEHIRNIPPDYRIYAPLEKPAPMIEYYAGRNISIAASYEAARQDMRETGVTRAVWVAQDQYRMKDVIVIK